MFRIQKLLTNEYSDFNEIVLVESPFAQVTDSGVGIRQVQLGLTPSKLIVGNDTFDRTKSNDLSNVYYYHEDPEIECMELVSILPLEFLYIKVFRKGSRQLMKVSVGTAKILWFEFGGYLSRNLHWNIWRDRISTLRANQTRLFYADPSQSMTTISSSSTKTDINYPDLHEVVAEVHRENSNLTNESRTMPIFFTIDDERTKICPSVKDLMGSYRCFPRTNSVSRIASNRIRCERSSAKGLCKSDQENVLREVAEYFLETQSDIVIGQHTLGYDSCDGSCTDFLFRSASVANLNHCLKSGYDGL